MFQECQNKHRVRKQNIEQNIRNVEKQADRHQREREIEIESGKGEKYTKREEKKKKWQTKTMN